MLEQTYPDGRKEEPQMGDFSQAFEAFVGHDPLTDPDPILETLNSQEDPRPPDPLLVSEGPTQEGPAAIVESIIDELLDPPSGAKIIVQSILEDLLSAVPSQPQKQPPPGTFQTPRPPGGLAVLPARVVRGKVQPPTIPSPGRPGRVTNQLLFIKRRVMPNIWTHKFTWPFKKPVDAIKLNLPDYHTIIKQPMDFGTIRKRLTAKYYWSAAECQEDIKLVFANCFLYNKPELDISHMGRTLEKLCEQMLDRMPQPEQDQSSLKAAVKRKGRPPGDRRKSEGEYGNKKARTADFEADIPVAQVGTNMGAYGLAPGKSTKRWSDSDSDSEEDDSISDGEFEDLGSARPPGARPSNHRPVPVPRTFQDERPGGLLTERKTIKNYCKYCDQAFLSKYVRDMHEKVKHGSGYVSAEKPKKMPVIKKPKKEPKSLQILPVVSSTPELAFPAGSQDLGLAPNITPQFSDTDLLNFVDKKHQAMNKHGKKNVLPRATVKKDPADSPQNNIKIPDDMLFPVPEEMLRKQGYMHNSSAPPPGYSQGNGSLNGQQMNVAVQNKAHGQMNVAVQNKAPGQMNVAVQNKAPGQMNAAVQNKAPGQMKVAVQNKAPGQMPVQARAPQKPKAAKSIPTKSPPIQAPAPLLDSKYDLQKELDFMEPTFTKSALGSTGPRLVAPPAQPLYLSNTGTIRASPGPSQEALIMARNAMRPRAPGQLSPAPSPHYSPTPGLVQRSASLGYDNLRSPEMAQHSPQSVHRGSIEERSPSFLPQQQRQGVIQENSYRVANGAMKAATTTSQSQHVAYTSAEPAIQQTTPRPIALESRSVIFPSKPLPKEELTKVQVLQAANPPPSFKPQPQPVRSLPPPVQAPPPPLKPVIDVLAQTLQLSEIDGFDFTEEKDMPGLVSTQELTLGDLKHLRSETVSIPSDHQLRLGGQMKQQQQQIIVSNGHDKGGFADLLDFNDITYQDVSQLIGPNENMHVYPEADGSFSEIIASGSQPTVMLQTHPSGRHQMVSQSFSLQPHSSLQATASMPTFSTDLVFSDMACLEPATVYTLEDKAKRAEEKWWA